MGYQDPPWVFKGKALYQLQLVKSEEARKYIPEQFKLVDLFGYTLGGFYLARYEDSPAGTFDELVAMAGLVWNPPTSCAWAARVYVNNREARDHGIHHVGLPSRLATFKLTGGSDGSAVQSGYGSRSWWWRPGQAAAAREPRGGDAPGDRTEQPRPEPTVLELRNVDGGRGRGLASPVCRITLPGASEALGPRITLSLPSFSGGTPEVPGLLRYACDLRTNVGLLAPLAVEVPPPVGRGAEDTPEYLAAVLGGRPLVTIEFAQMEMRVEEPEALLLSGQDQHRLQAAASQRWAGARAASLTAAWAAKRVGA